MRGQVARSNRINGSFCTLAVLVISWIETFLRLSTFLDQISSSSSSKTLAIWRFVWWKSWEKIILLLRPEFLAQCAWHLCERLSENQFVTKSTTGREIVEFRHRKPPLLLTGFAIISANRGKLMSRKVPATVVACAAVVAVVGPGFCRGATCWCGLRYRWISGISIDWWWISIDWWRFGAQKVKPRISTKLFINMLGLWDTIGGYVW